MTAAGGSPHIPTYPKCDPTCTTDCGHCKGDHERARAGQERARTAEEDPGCAMYREDSFPFAACETHDEVFPLGATCSMTRGHLQRLATAARARGDQDAERQALDLIHLDDRSRKDAR